MSKLIDAIICKNLPARDLKNANRVNLWAIAWAASLAIISFISKYDWYSANLPITMAFVFSSGIGVGMILAYKRFLKELDEMERKIQLDALASSVGVTLVAFGGYSILAKAGSAPDLKASSLIVLMALTYMAGIIIGRIRYQ
jgi:cyanate permease